MCTLNLLFDKKVSKIFIKTIEKERRNDKNEVLELTKVEIYDISEQIAGAMIDVTLVSKIAHQ